jgi:hypothetical protein
MNTQLAGVTVYGFRLVARFVVLLVALSVMFDLMGQISVDYLEQEGPFEPTEQAFSSALYLGMLNEDWGKGSLAGFPRDAAHSCCRVGGDSGIGG